MKKIFAANWKMYKAPDEVASYMETFKTGFSVLADKAEVAFFPSAVLWPEFAAQKNLFSQSGFRWGAQNIFPKSEGAYTGENSMAVLHKLGGTLSLVGHSERRQLFGESEAFIAEKVAGLQKQGLTPVLCIGETLIERQALNTESVLETQLELGLSLSDPGLPLIVAYEPVWAIGTGEVASVDQVKDAHGFIKDLLIKKGFVRSPILYGGSVKPENSQELSVIPNVDGFLIGGASLKPESLLEVIKNAI